VGTLIQEIYGFPVKVRKQVIIIFQLHTQGKN